MIEIFCVALAIRIVKWIMQLPLLHIGINSFQHFHYTPYHPKLYSQQIMSSPIICTNRLHVRFSLADRACCPRDTGSVQSPHWRPVHGAISSCAWHRHRIDTHLQPSPPSSLSLSPSPSLSLVAPLPAAITLPFTRGVVAWSDAVPRVWPQHRQAS